MFSVYWNFGRGHSQRPRLRRRRSTRECLSIHRGILVSLPQTTCSLTASVTSTPCIQVCHSDVMEVVLNCWARGGYGLILQRNPVLSDNQARAPLCVTYIEKGSPADKCGIVHVGDRVLVINDWCTANGTAEEANYIVRHATGPLTLTIEFDVIDAALPSNGVFTIKLAKKGQNLGIGIASSASTQKGDPVIVSDVRTGSVAHRCGAIQVGDHILAIDNIPLDTCTVEEASRLLQRSPDTVKLRLKKNSGDELEAIPGNNPLTGQQTIVYSVELNRKNGPLGLTIAGTDDRFDPIFISQLAHGGLADKIGAVRVGDRILAINGQSLTGKRVSEALQVLHQAGDTISLKIARAVSSLGDHSTSRAGLAVHNATASVLSNYGPPLLQTVGSDRGPPIFNEHFGERATTDKLGTPVQSIDSAVESLEDGPVSDSQQPSATTSNRTSQNSKSSSLSGAPHSDVGLYGLSAEELSVQLQRTLNAIKVASNGGGTSQGSRQSDAGSSSVSNAATDEEHYAQLAGVAVEGCPCPNHTSGIQSQEEWVRVLEALESVGEAEILKKVEESAASVLGVSPGTSGTPENTLPSLPPKPPPKPHLAPPFPVSNPLLKQTYPSASRLVSTSYLSMVQEARPIMTVANNGASTRDAVAMAASILSPGLGSSSSFGPIVAPSAICASPRPLSVSTILSGYEHIPFISTPVPSRASSSAPQAPIMDRPTSPHPNPLGDLTSPTSNRLLFPAAPGSGPGESNVVPLEIFRVQLAKDKVYNDFGFSVSDGVQEKGVYINKIRSGGPAELSGSIRPLDRILQVNGSSLLDLDCMLAVPMLAAAGDQIDLVICRDPVLAATYRTTTDSIEEEDEEEAEAATLVGQTTV